jgi:hypothetical protein
MSNGQCIITGCNFLDVDEAKWVHGDLYQFFDTLIFNYGDLQWFICAKNPLDPTTKMVRADHYFEKNGMLVFPLAIAGFNEHAHKHLMDMLRAEEKQIITFGKH